MLERLRSALRPRLVRRNFHVFGVGTARSGTRSLYEMFAGSYRAVHEPDSEALMSDILDRAAGRLDQDTLRARLMARDRLRWLEMNSSQLNYFVLRELVELFPRALFVLTIRDCHSWLRSFLDHQLSGPSSPNWVRMRALRFERPGAVHPPQEKVLSDHGLYTLDGYLSYWARHNRDVLSLVPPSRLLVVRTDRISSSAAELASFVGASAAKLRPDAAHSNRAVARHRIVELIDRDYLLAAYERHCGALMREFFGGVAVPH